MRILLISTILITVALAFSFRGPAMAQSKKELVQQGSYILNAVQGCECHTPRNRDGSLNRDRYLAGAPSNPPPFGPPPNVGWTNPRWKKLFASNITPDNETGIGKWKESEFIKTMRSGMTPDGKMLDTFMPWVHYGGITDRDLKAIWAYLRSIKPIKNKVPNRIPAQR